MAVTNDPAILTTRILGITSSIFLSGFAFSPSYYTLPALALSPLPLRLKQWQVVYDLGKLVSPPVAAAGGLLWGYNAYDARGNEAMPYYAIASACTLGVLIWTAGVMMPANKELGRRAITGKAETGIWVQESEFLLEKWDRMNMVRAILPMVRAWAGLYAALT